MKRLAVDARFEEAVDRVEEVVAVELRVKAEDRWSRAARPGARLAPRADAERLGVGPGDVPEGDDRRARQPLADHARQRARSGSPAPARSGPRCAPRRPPRRRTAG